MVGNVRKKKKVVYFKYTSHKYVFHVFAISHTFSLVLSHRAKVFWSYANPPCVRRSD